jgi:very-short-patch-repair endonuclease
LKFVRQAAIGPYFVDFLCRKLKVIVEVDGGTHSTGAEMVRDAARSSYLEARGYRLVRAHNSEVAKNVDGVLETLLAFVQQRES